MNGGVCQPKQADRRGEGWGLPVMVLTLGIASVAMAAAFSWFE
jgi:hypothetical protein